jgi:hypothetical protein
MSQPLFEVFALSLLGILPRGLLFEARPRHDKGSS